MYHSSVWPGTTSTTTAESASGGAPDVVAALRHGWPLIAACVALGLLAAIAYVSTTPSIYAANTQILFEPKRVEIAGAAEREATQLSIEGALIESQIQILKSERVSDMVVEALQLDSDPEFAEPRVSPLSRLLNILLGSSAATRRNVAIVGGEFEKRLDVRRIGQSYALDLWFRSTEPAKSARIANAIAAAYIAQQLGDAGRTGRRSQFQKSFVELDADRRTAAESVRTGKIDLASFPIADARILKAAQIPLGRAAPRTNLILGLAVAFSLLVGASLVVVLQRIRRIILTRRQIEDDLGIPCLGVLPGIAPPPSGGQQNSTTIAAEQPDSLFGRGVNAVRAALDAHSDRAKPQCIGVVAARPREGKTLVAANIAHAFASCGWRTLLIDCDLKPDAVCPSLSPSQTMGLADALRGAELDAVKRQEGALTVLAAGRATEGDARIIGTPRFRAVLDAARTRFDRIVLDLPSIDRAPDAVITCSWLDATLIVMSRGQTSELVARQLLADLRRAHVGYVGGVLNNLPGRPWSQFI